MTDWRIEATENSVRLYLHLPTETTRKNSRAEREGSKVTGEL